MVAGETAFSTTGFILLMTASACSGLRWALTQILLLRHRATSNPIASLFFLTPAMFAVLAIVALIGEGLGPLLQGLGALFEKKGTGLSIVLLILPGCLAFCMTAVEFALLKRTSVVTLSVCGIFKEVITIIAGEVLFDDKLTPVNISGVFVTIIAIVGYNYIRLQKVREATTTPPSKQAGTEESAPMLSTDFSPINGEPRGRTLSTTDMIHRSLRSSMTNSARRNSSKQDLR